MTTQTYNDNVEVLGSRDIDQLKIKANASQTTPLQTWEDATSILSQVTHDGRVQVGDDLGMSTPDSLMESHRADTSTTKPKRGFHSLGRISGTLNSIIYWIAQELELVGTGGISALHSALRVRLTNQNTGTMTNAELRAGDFEAINMGGTSGSPVTKMVGIKSVVTNQPSSYINDGVGVEIGITKDPASGNIVSAYGIRIADINQGQTNNYALYSGLGTSHFGDDQELKILANAPTSSPPSGFIRMYPKLVSGSPKLFAKDSSGTETQLVGGGSTLPAGVLMPYAGATVPSDWLMCDGSVASRTTYANLYSAIGNLHTSAATLTTRSSDTQGVLTFANANHGLTAGAATLKLRFFRQNTVQSVNTSLDQLIFATSPAFVVGDRIRVASTGSLPAPLSASTDYYVISVTSTAITLSTTSGGSVINITSAGSGTITVSGQDEGSCTNMTISSVVGSAVTVTGSGITLPIVNTAITVECDSGLFFLPDMRGRTAIGAGQGTGLTDRTLAQAFGEENHTLSISEMPSHTHSILRTNNGAAGGTNGIAWNPNISSTTTIANNTSTGGGGSHNNIQPSLALNYIIKT